jgi:hypothetical protein
VVEGPVEPRVEQPVNIKPGEKLTQSCFYFVRMNRSRDVRMISVLVANNYLFYSSTHVKISQVVNKMCSQQACSKLVNKL